MASELHADLRAIADILSATASKLREWRELRSRDGGGAPFADVVDFLIDYNAWQQETFGPHQNTEGILRHIEKEIVEVRENPESLFEWVDIILLACNGALRNGWSPSQIVAGLVDKMARNKKRAWPDWRTLDPDEPIEHVREEGGDE